MGVPEEEEIKGQKMFNRLLAETSQILLNVHMLRFQLIIIKKLKDTQRYNIQ